MAGIKGSVPKRHGSYAETAKQNAEQEREAMRLKKAAEAKAQQEALQKAMLGLDEEAPLQELNSTPTAIKESVLVQEQPIPIAAVEPVPTVVVESTPLVVVEPVPTTVEEPTPLVEKAKTKRNVVKKDTGELATFSDGAIQFNGQFLIKETKSKEFSTIGFSAPMEIALEAKVKAARDKLSLFELNNLLLALYLEKGLPKEFLERYRKSFN